jgi:hypothetical protein
LQRVVHEVADDDGVLSARADIDATMARGMARCRRQPERVVKRKIVVDKERLTGRDHRLAIEPPNIAAAAGPGFAALGRFLPRGIFAFVEDVFGFGKGRHPGAITQHGVPAGMIDVQMRAKDVIDVLEAQAFGGEAVEPRLFRKIHRWRIALVLAGAGIDQNCVFGGAHDVSLIGDHHFARRRIEHFAIEIGEMAADLRIVFWKHFLRCAPRAVPLDDAGNRNVANRELVHFVPLPCAGLSRLVSLPPTL